MKLFEERARIQEQINQIENEESQEQMEWRKERDKLFVELAPHLIRLVDPCVSSACDWKDRCLYCTLMHAVENKEWLEEYEVLLELYRR
jgi:hypothetical protein